jgi:hypothetical protein
MSFEQLQNIIDFNNEQAKIPDEDLENNLCPFDAWELDINSKGQKSCPICGRIWVG